MQDGNPYLRSLEQAMVNMVVPGTEYEIPETRRYKAIGEVLSRIPEPDYSHLVDLKDTFTWFIPNQYGSVEQMAVNVYPSGDERPMPVTVHFPGAEHPEQYDPGPERLRPYCRCLYLSPELEQRSRQFAVAAVAHELAHILLNHNLMPFVERYAQELEAWAKVRDWGFVVEEREHARYYKWLHAVQQTLLRKAYESQHHHGT